MASYATQAELANWLKGGEYEADTPTEDAAARVLDRASRLILRCTAGTYEPDPDADPQVPVTITDALRDATCAVVEQWLEVGEENDIAGYNRRKSLSVGSVTLGELPSRLAPRAADILAGEGILNAYGRQLADEDTETELIPVDIV